MLSTLNERELVKILGHAVEFKDETTGYHVVRVSHYVYILATALGLEHNHAVNMAYASMLHDVGKIGIPDAVLQKKGKLTAEERKRVEQHCAIGAAIIGNHPDSPLLTMAHDIALCHHERWDGTGYPQRLSGTSIPLAARITAVADVFDAMTAPRPYRAECTFERTLTYVVGNSGSHFDPAIVEQLVEHIDKFAEIRIRYATPTVSDFLEILK